MLVRNTRVEDSTPGILNNEYSLFKSKSLFNQGRELKAQHLWRLKLPQQTQRLIVYF